MRRVSLKDCEDLEEKINKMLEFEESSARILFSHRYDYYAVDLIDSRTATFTETLGTGTRKEVYLFLLGLSEWPRITS